MLPMLYIPKNNQILDREFAPPFPEPGNADIWCDVWNVAKGFWRLVGADKRVSKEFQAIARSNLKKLDAQKDLLKLLPQEV